jgi:hypothetical protein
MTIPTQTDIPDARDHASLLNVLIDSLRHEVERLRKDNAELRGLVVTLKNRSVLAKCDECKGTGYDPDMKDRKCGWCDGKCVCDYEMREDLI